MKLKSTVSILQEIEINLDTPAFFKQGNYCRGIIEESFISIFQIEGMRTWISHDSTEASKREIIEAYQSWEHISEEEFFEAMNKALKDFNFKPSLRVVNAKEGSEVSL
jgi:hypothetical protein